MGLRGLGGWSVLQAPGRQEWGERNRTLMKARDPGVGSAADFSKAWEISLQNEIGREERQK